MPVIARRPAAEKLAVAEKHMGGIRRRWRETIAGMSAKARAARDVGML